MNHSSSAAGSSVEKPTEAGIYDYLAGGTHHTAADRAAAERVLELTPEAKTLALENRQFLRRAVTYLAGQGVTQYLDLGSGYPVSGEVHEIAGGIVADPHVVYVDHDPTVVEKSAEFFRGRAFTRLRHRKPGRGR